MGIIVTTLFFTDEDERIQRESKAVFYGQTTVLTSWGSGVGVSPLNGVVLGSGVATSTARQEEKSHSPGRLYLTSKRLLFVKDWGDGFLAKLEGPPKLVFSVPLRVIQSVTYQTKALGLGHGVGISYLTGSGILTASFVGLDEKKDREAAQSWVSEITSAVEDARKRVSSDQKHCTECGKQIIRTAKFCPECGAKLA